MFAAICLRGLDPLAHAGAVEITQTAVYRDFLLGVRFDVHSVEGKPGIYGTVDGGR